MQGYDIENIIIFMSVSVVIKNFVISICGSGTENGKNCFYFIEL